MKTTIIRVLLTVALFPSISFAQSVFYISSGDIYQVNTNGSGNRQVSNDPTIDWSSLAVDDIAHRLYTYDSTNQSIVSMDFNGGSRQTLVAGIQNAADFALDATAGKLFFIHYGNPAAKISSINLNGSGQTDIFTLSGDFNSAGLAVDTANQRVYFADSNVTYSSNPNSARIASINYSGGSLAAIYNTYTDWKIAVNDGSLVSYGYYSLRTGSTDGLTSQQNVYNWNYPDDSIGGLSLNSLTGSELYFSEYIGSGPDRIAALHLGDNSVSTVLSVNGQIGTLAFSQSISAVPEPSTYALVAGFAALGGLMLRRRAASGLVSSLG